MKRISSLVLVVALAGLVVQMLRAGDALPEKEARENLQAGAVVIDVRTPEEFKGKSLPGVINVPLNTIQAGITNYVTNKSQVVLLHCRTGRRSGVAESELRSLGYTNAFNIGSFEQAEKVLQDKGN